MPVDPRLDARHHITLVDEQYREALARVEGDTIPDYISWMLDNQLIERQGVIARQAETRARAAAHLDVAEWFRLHAESIENKVRFLKDCWLRNLRMSVAEEGKGRSEVIQALTNETGRILPSEMAPRTTAPAQNGQNGQAPPARKSWFPALKKG